MILNLRNCREWYFDYLSIRTLNLYAGSGECLGGFHALNCAAHTPSVDRDDLNVIFAVKWLQSCQCLGYFHG